MNVYAYVFLFDSPRKDSFAIKIINSYIYFISFTKFWYSTSSHNICSSFIWLYEFEIFCAKVFFENIVNTFEKTSISTSYITIFTFIFQYIIKFVSSSSVFWSSYTFEVSEISIDVTCVIYRGWLSYLSNILSINSANSLLSLKTYLFESLLHRLD